MSLRVVCAWCDAVMEPGDGSGRKTSHGICPDCDAKLQAEAEPVRLDLVAHLREQIENDPEAYANEAKLRAVADRIVRG